MQLSGTSEAFDDKLISEGQEVSNQRGGCESVVVRAYDGRSAVPHEYHKGLVAA